MSNARRKQLPPKNRRDVHDVLDVDVDPTKEGEHFLAVSDAENSIVIFIVKCKLMFSSDVQTILMDGTFNFCM